MDKILVYRQEVDRLLVYIQGFLGRSVGLEEVRGGGLLRLDDRVVACLLEESRLPFKKLVHEVHRRLEVKVLKDGCWGEVHVWCRGGGGESVGR